jgi:hypothetical protein
VGELEGKHPGLMPASPGWGRLLTLRR